MWNGDIIRHNFKWNICDVMKRKNCIVSSGVTMGGPGGTRPPQKCSLAPPKTFPEKRLFFANIPIIQQVLLSGMAGVSILS